MRATLIASILLLIGAGGAGAQDIKAPRISFLAVKWDTALAELDKIEALRPSSPVSMLNALARLNEATGKDFPNIAASPVPVLLPLNLEAYLRGKNEQGAVYPPGIRPSKFFLAGPAGYDAAFIASVPAAAARSKPRPDRDVEVQISGMALLYEIGERVGGEEKPPNGLQADFPDIRRLYSEGHMRYLFERYGVLYSVFIECFDGRSHYKKLSCNDAHTIAVRFLKALTVAGGKPQPVALSAASPVDGRPDKVSTAFTYYPPGQLISGTGARHRGGHADPAVYAKIRFPLAEAPAHTYSQVFMNMGNCAELSSRTIKRYGAPFRCPSGGKVANAAMPGSADNRYPWRDSFCESRGFFVGQCPSGIGHQGQDIVPVDCQLSNHDASHCDRNQHRVVAAHDGLVLRASGQEGLVIVANAPGTHLRFRYLHMNPKLIDEDGFLSGRVVREGETIGKVGNYSGREAGTSYHLHFDMQVPTKDGWALVNPYMTLVTAYERLIGGRGRQIGEAARDAPGSAMDVERTASVTATETGPSPSKQKSRSRGR